MAIKIKSITVEPVESESGKVKVWKIIRTKNILEWYPGQNITASEYESLVNTRGIDVTAKERKG